MKVFIALDLYDNMVRVATTAELAEKWLLDRAVATWSGRSLEHSEWKDAGKDTRDLISDTHRWPYRIIEQSILTEPTPVITTLPNGVQTKEMTDTIVRGTD
jgi:hypothetical protein